MLGSYFFVLTQKSNKKSQGFMQILTEIQFLKLKKLLLRRQTVFCFKRSSKTEFPNLHKAGPGNCKYAFRIRL